MTEELARFGERVGMQLSRLSRSETIAGLNQIVQSLRRSRTLKWLVLFGQIGLGLILLWQIARWGNIDADSVLRRLTAASLLPLTAGVIFFLGSMCLGALRYRLFFTSPISVQYLLGVTLVQNLLLTFIPWRVGELGYPVILRRDYAIPFAQSGAVILGVRLVDLVIVFTISILGAGKLGLMSYLENLKFVIMGCVLFIIAIVLWKRDAFSKSKGLFLAIDSIRTANRLLVFFSISVLIFVFTTVQSAFILKAVGLEIAPLDVAFLNSTTLIAALLPVHPPGGWGTIDSVQLFILGRLNFDPLVVAPAILAAHSVYTLLIVGGGIVGWGIRERRVGSRAGA